MSSNNGLYFMMGGLLVAVLVIGGLYFAKTDQGEQIVRETHTFVENSTDSQDSGSSFELTVDDEGFSASSKNEE